MTQPHVVLVSTEPTARHARTTVRSVPSGARVHVLDVDGSFVPVGAESVLRPADVGWDDATLHRAAAVEGPDALVERLRPDLAAAVAASVPADAVLVCLGAGVQVLGDLTELVALAARTGFLLVPHTDGWPAGDGRHPDASDLASAGSYSPQLLVLRADADDVLAAWRAATQPPSTGPHWLDVAAATVPHATADGPHTLLSAWGLRPEHVLTGDDDVTLDGAPLVALDLTGLDPLQPWRLDAEDDTDLRGRLSEHPVLAGVVAQVARRLAVEPVGAPTWSIRTTSLGHVVDATLRAAFLAANADAPDPFDPAETAALRSWLTAAGPDGAPGRYLTAVRSTRPDLVASFPRVPGADTTAFVAWAAKHAVSDGYPADLVEPSLVGVTSPPPAPRTRAPGVNVVGFLRGELGIGESARLLVSALAAAGVPYATRSVDRHLTSRQRASGAASPQPTHAFDTTILCVNADLTPAIAASVPDLLERTYRIGMWYWEVEDFPASQHGGFAAVDEVWVATDFVREAIGRHAPVPVRTITPPLPQRRPLLAGIDRAALGVPDAFTFLFVFDYLSTFERKNPLGVVDAFSQAFAPGEGPVLVLKSINADRRPAQAERLRLAVAGRTDIVLLEDYLSADERDALVALCDCYVSLHRSEGLGLTMAEAMAWGKPTIATGYSGNLQFMTGQNSYLVPWRPTAVPPGAEPYPQGSVWAEPDIGAAAALLRRVVDDPESAAATGARAAADIATLHSAEVAGVAVAARLTDLAGARRRRSHPGPLSGVRILVRRLRARAR